MASPRLLCKSRGRHWTRGGSLRSIPIGLGFRKNNKRSAGAPSSMAKQSSNQPGLDARCPPPPDQGAVSLCASTSGIDDVMLNLLGSFTDLLSLHGHLRNILGTFPGLALAFAGPSWWSNVASIFPGIFLATAWGLEQHLVRARRLLVGSSDWIHETTRIQRKQTVKRPELTFQLSSCLTQIMVSCVFLEREKKVLFIENTVQGVGTSSQQDPIFFRH